MTGKHDESDEQHVESQSEPTDPKAEGPDSRTASDGESAEQQKARKHGKGFVYIGLKDCDDALRKIDSHEKAMAIEQFAKALGHSAPKGRFIHKLDALKEFGLIEDDTSESVRLSHLADDMLYGASKSKARTTAFLNYSDFKRLFVDFAKAHDYPRSEMINYIRAKLGIVNEVDRFLRLFLESAEFAGLLEGKADSKAKVIRLRPAPQSSGASTKTDAVGSKPDDQFSVMPADEVDDFLDAAGLTQYKPRAEVRQRTTGQFSLSVGDGGKITIEITRPIQIVVQPENLITDIPKILEAMQQRGLRA